MLAVAPAALGWLGTSAGLVPPRDATELEAWVRDAAPADVLASLTWIAATALATWFATCALLYAACAALGAARGAAGVARLAPGVRRLVDRTLVLGLAATAVVGQAPAIVRAEPVTTTTTSAPFGPDAGIVVRTNAQGRFVVSAADRTDATHPARPGVATVPTTVAITPPEATPPGTTPPATAPTTTAPTTVPPPAPSATTPARGAPATPPVTATSERPAAQGPAARHHRVVAGDNLWRIAATTLSRAIGREPTDAEVVPYWREVCALNRSTLRSRDPDLIFPGELVALAPLPPSTA